MRAARMQALQLQRKVPLLSACHQDAGYSVRSYKYGVKAGRLFCVCLCMSTMCVFLSEGVCVFFNAQCVCACVCVFVYIYSVCVCVYVVCVCLYIYSVCLYLFSVCLLV